MGEKFAAYCCRSWRVARSSDSQPKYGSGRVISRHCRPGRRYLLAPKGINHVCGRWVSSAFGIAAVVANPAAFAVVQGRVIAARTGPGARTCANALNRGAADPFLARRHGEGFGKA